jgi:hypothetical protein
MKFTAPIAAVALAAFTASGNAQAALPRLPDLSGDEASALAIYAVPSLLAATRQTCADQLSPDGFLARRGDSLSARYAAEQNAVWPMARSALFKVAAAKAGDKLKQFTTLPDDAIRPLADALIQQEAAEKIHPKSCRNVERMAQALSPLEPADVGRVLGTMFDIASEGDKVASLLGNRPSRP